MNTTNYYKVTFAYNGGITTYTGPADSEDDAKTKAVAAKGYKEGTYEITDVMLTGSW